MAARSEPHEVLKALAMLQAGPGERGVVVTCAPQIWRGIESEQTTVCDVSTMLGGPQGRADTWAGSEKAFEDHVEGDLVGQGWPQSWVIRGYRPDLKIPFACDVAVVDAEGRLLLAVEAKTRPLPRQREYQLATQLKTVGALWICLATPDSYRWRPTTAGEWITSAAPPTPKDLGASPPVSGSEHHFSVVETPESFSALIRHAKPEWTVLDFTLPLGWKRENPWLGKLREHVLGLPLEMDANGLRDADLQVLLMLWLATLDPSGKITAFYGGLLAWADRLALVRAHLEQQPGFRAAISLGGSLRRSSTSIDAYAYFLGPSEGPWYFDRLVSPEELADFEEREWFTSLTAFLAGKTPGAGNVVTKGSQERWDYGPEQADVPRIQARLAGLGPSMEMSAICEIRQGPATGARPTADRRVRHPDSHIPQIRLRATGHGAVSLEDSTSVPESSLRREDVLQPGDVLVTRVFGTSGPLVAVFDWPTRATCSGSLFRLRLRDDAVSPAYLATYLQSPSVTRMLNAMARGSEVARRISMSALRSLAVPVLDKGGGRAFDEVVEAETRLRTLVDDVSSKRHQLFEHDSSAQVVDRLQQLRSITGVAVGGIEQASSLPYRVSNFYPYPIAYGYRGLSSHSDVEKRYAAQIAYAEKIASFVGSLTMALVQPEDQAQTGIRLKSHFVGGVNMGEWLDIASRACRVLASYKDHTLSSSVSGLFPEDDTQVPHSLSGPLNELLNLRNNYTHGGDDKPTTDQEFRQASDSASEYIDACLEHLAFLMDYPIRLVTDYDTNDSDEFEVQCEILTGDHPSHPVEVIRSRLAPRKQRLYIDDGHNPLRRLNPFLTMQLCQKCRWPEVYFVDRWNRRSEEAKLKSFERGHTEIFADVSMDVGRWPLSPSG